eukprot:jgi/Hompol1/4202/HPOL_006979-RA
MKADELIAEFWKLHPEKRPGAKDTKESNYTKISKRKSMDARSTPVNDKHDEQLAKKKRVSEPGQQKAPVASTAHPASPKKKSDTNSGKKSGSNNEEPQIYKPSSLLSPSIASKSSWEDDIDAIETVEPNADTGSLTVYINWKN